MLFALRFLVLLPLLGDHAVLDRPDLEAADEVRVRADRKGLLVAHLRDYRVLRDLLARDQAQHGAPVERPFDLRLAQPHHPSRRRHGPSLHPAVVRHDTLVCSGPAP
jgi:hypothetical protein